MTSMRAGIKFLLFSLVLIFYFIVTIPLYPFLKLFPFTSRFLINRFMSFISFLCIAIFNIKVHFSKAEELSEQGPFLIVSNHLSYLDVFVISSRFPSCFVTSVEIKNTPFLGHICQLAGCVFVERRNRRNLSEEISELTENLKHGNNIVVFPEATSTNGEGVKRFKRPLFGASLYSEKQVLPVSINYKKLDGKPISVESRDNVFWYGDMTFFDHFWNFLKLKRIEVEVTIGDVVSPGSFGETTSLSSHCFEKVSSNYNPVT